MKYKGEKCVGDELLKNHLPLLICCNMSGKNKKKLFIIGKSENPRCFKGVKSPPVIYKSNQKAWMSLELFFATYKVG